jgi:hypothetical protein
MGSGGCVGGRAAPPGGRIISKKCAVRLQHKFY